MNFIHLARRVIAADELAHIWIVWILVPLVVVAEVAACVVRRIGQDHVDLPALAIEGRHRLKVVTLDYKVPRTAVLVPGAQRLDGPLIARPNTAADLTCEDLSGE